MGTGLVGRLGLRLGFVFDARHDPGAVSSAGRQDTAAALDPLPNGWKIELTLRNQSDETFSQVVATVCLQLPASGGFEDPNPLSQLR